MPTCKVGVSAFGGYFSIQVQIQRSRDRSLRYFESPGSKPCGRSVSVALPSA
jgi:hypothetical protein